MISSRKNSKRRSRKLKKVAKRLATYSAAAVATLMTTQNRTANAAEVVWDIADISMSTTSTGVSFHMVGGATTYGRGGFYYFSEGNFRVTAEFGGYIYGPAYATTAPVGALGFIGSGSENGLPQAASDPVSASDAFIVNGPYFSNYYAYLDWSDGQNAFAGIRFDLGGSTHFGWAQITKGIGPTAGEFILHGFGYNNTPNAPSHPTDTEDILKLGVNEDTGEITLVGDPDRSMSINFYQILSIGMGGSADGLTPTTWNSLEDQDAADVDGNGAVDGADFMEWQTTGGTAAVLAAWEANYGSSAPGDGWQESVGSSTSALGESYLLGDTTIPAGGSISLGEGYDEQKDTRFFDLPPVKSTSACERIQPGL